MSRPRALVTGAARRVGRAIALELAASGFDVLIHCNRSVDEARQVAADARALGAVAEVVSADLATVDGCAALVEGVAGRWDALEVLVNNASVFEPRALEAIDLAHWEWMQAVNSRAPFLLCRDLVGHLRRADRLPAGPAILNLCDVGNQRALRFHLAYSVSKIGVEMLTRTLALELAPEVRTMGVAPGQVIWPETYDDAKRARLAERIPMKRVGTPEDVARAARFLILEGAYLNGAILPVDGGLQHRMVNMDWIVLNRLRFDAIVGILPSEQVAPQPLEIEIKLGVDLDACGATGDLSKSVDYAAVADQVRFIAQHGRWRLIESMGTCIARLVLAPPAPQDQRAQVDRVELRIAKPTILGDLAVPEVVLRRKADWVRLLRRDVPSRTTLETLEATPLSAAYRVHIAPGTSWEPPPQVALKVIAGRPRHEGRTLGPGDTVARMATVFENHQKQVVTLLAVGHPIS